MDADFVRTTFDTNRFNFRDLAIEGINRELAPEYRVSDLEYLHEVPDLLSNVEHYRQVMFKLFRTQEFQKVFRAFGLWLIETYFNPSALIQKTPTVRIHPPRREVRQLSL